MSILVVTRGAKTGRCNICGNHGALTEDHTPPKGCLKPTQVELLHIAHLLSEGQQTKVRGRQSQNGVKYRTLCHRCNNALLGAKYDPAFISFVNDIGTALKSTLHLPSVVTVRGQPQAILRSLVGHLSAQGVDGYLKGPLTEPIRDYFLDTSKPVPEGLHAFYWAYPYRPHVMFRDAIYIDIPYGMSWAIWMLKFFPVTFLLTLGKPTHLTHPIHTFDPWRASAFNATVEIPLTIRPVPPLSWPEAPTEQSALVYGQEAIFAKR